MHSGIVGIGGGLLQHYEQVSQSNWPPGTKLEKRWQGTYRFLFTETEPVIWRYDGRTGRASASLASTAGPLTFLDVAALEEPSVMGRRLGNFLRSAYGARSSTYNVFTYSTEACVAAVEVFIAVFRKEKVKGLALEPCICTSVDGWGWRTALQKYVISAHISEENESGSIPSHLVLHMSR